MIQTAAASRCAFKALAYLFVVAILTLLPVAEARAQSSSTDGTTPLALAPGSPAGSYALSDLENVNLYNGGMSIHLPLYQVSGRGGGRLHDDAAYRAALANSVHTRHTLAWHPFV